MVSLFPMERTLLEDAILDQFGCISNLLQDETLPLQATQSLLFFAERGAECLSKGGVSPPFSSSSSIGVRSFLWHARLPCFLMTLALLLENMFHKKDTRKQKEALMQ